MEFSDKTVVRSRSPVRISFGGGGTDIPPFCDERGGCVVSGTINKYSYATLIPRSDDMINIESGDFLEKMSFGSVDEMSYDNRLDLLKAVIKNMNFLEKGMNIFLRSDVPPKSGLGSSAAAFVAMIGLFNHLKREKAMTPYEIADLAYRLEREELKIGGGKQDQYASVFGGLNFIEFADGSVRVNQLRMKKDHILELEKHLILVYTKPRGVSGDIINSQVSSYKEKKKDVIEAFETNKAIAHEMRFSLLKGDLERFGSLLHKAWESKKKYSNMISNPFIDNLYETARKNGALGGKISGAGGGGFMILYCEPNKEHIVSEKLLKLGAVPYTFTFDFEGLQTWEV